MAQAEIPCPADNGRNYTTSAQHTYVLNCGTDIKGGDLTTTDAKTYLDCMTFCDNYTSDLTVASAALCIGASWRSPEFGSPNCYLKFSILDNALVPNSNVYSVRWAGFVIGEGPIFTPPTSWKLGDGGLSGPPPSLSTSTSSATPAAVTNSASGSGSGSGSTSTSTSTTTSSPISPIAPATTIIAAGSSSASSLPQGAMIGIGVGIGVGGVLLLGALTILVLRRRRRKRPRRTQEPSDPPIPPSEPKKRHLDTSRLQEVRGHDGPELQGDEYSRELQGNEYAAELDASRPGRGKFGERF